MDILMPQLGETVTEGTILNWYKSIGDTISAGDNLFEIETDKTTMEVPATVAGVLSEIKAATGTTVPVGSVVAVLSEAGASEPAAATSTPADSSPVKPTADANFDPLNPVKSPAKNFGRATLANGVETTPLARRLAAENDVDLSTAAGSGPNGRIAAKDIMAALTTRDAGKTSPSATPLKALYAGVPFEERPVDGMRRIIATRLAEAKQTIPHFYLSSDVLLDRLIALRSEINGLSAEGPKVSLNDFFIKALAFALKRVPQANAVWAGDSILAFARADVGVAVAVEGGLFTPVVRDADSRSVMSICREMRSFIAQARSKSLKPADYSGGSASISNLGMYGVSSFSAIINPPQSAILAIGAAERRPREGADGAVEFASVMTVTLSCDHRVIDGALGAQLLASFRDALQTPLSLLI